jgi:TonB family protein
MTEAWKQYEGQVVDGKFHLRQYVGGSDHSAVFLTELNGGVSQKAAIKFVPADDVENSANQIAQWRVASKLSHPHLVQIYDAGRCHLGGRNLFFLVTEYAEENVAQILPHRALTSEEARDMLPPVLEVLSNIHNQGLVHGHVKPGNIMAVHDQLKISSDGLSSVGTPGKRSQELGLYSAPETEKGVTPASDVWSLGMTLVEVLTQRPLLWDGRGEPVVPETVPPPFRNIASHCLRQDPQRRWTIAEIAAGLRSPAKPAAAEPSRLPAKARADTPLTRSRFVGPTVAVVVLVAAMVAGRNLLHHASDPQPNSPPPASIPAATSATDSAARQKPSAAETASPAKAGGGQVQPKSAARPAGRSGAAPKNSSAGSAHGAVVQQVLPVVSPSARRTIEGKIRVRIRVEVDSSGNVTDAKFESAGPSRYFSNKTMEAARNWKFAPPQGNGQTEASTWVLKFAIGRTSTTAESSQTSP